MRSYFGPALGVVGVLLLASCAHAGLRSIAEFDQYDGEGASSVLFKKAVKVSDDITLQVAFNKKKDGKLIVFLHGFPEGALVWEKVAMYFSDYSVAAPDQRGYHDSTRPDDVDAYAVNNLSRDIYNMVKKLNQARGVTDKEKQKFLLVAHDWGGLVAWNYAHHYPETLAGFVVMNCPHPIRYQEIYKTDKASQEAASYLLRILNHPTAMRHLMGVNDYYFLRKSYGEGILSDGVMEDLKDSWGKSLKTQIDWYLANTHCDSTSYFNPCTWENMTLKFKEDLVIPSSVPTLFIWGEKDPMYLDINCTGLGKWVKNLEVRRIPDAAHFPNVDSAKRVAELIREFNSRINY